MLIPKPDEAIIRKDYYRQISLINIDAEVLKSGTYQKIHSSRLCSIPTEL